MIYDVWTRLKDELKNISIFTTISSAKKNKQAGNFQWATFQLCERKR
jgi:hypothetical protein